MTDGPRLNPSEDEVRQDEAGQTVLVVDDEPDLRRIATVILERAGYNVVTAGDGQAALDVIAEHGSAISAVVSDVIMPNVSGAELLERMRTKAPSIPVGLMSGYTADILSAHGVGNGSVALLAKPWRPNDLVAFVQALIQTRAGQSA